MAVAIDAYFAVGRALHTLLVKELHSGGARSALSDIGRRAACAGQRAPSARSVGSRNEAPAAEGAAGRVGALEAVSRARSARFVCGDKIVPREAGRAGVSRPTALNTRRATRIAPIISGKKEKTLLA